MTDTARPPLSHGGAAGGNSVNNSVNNSANNSATSSFNNKRASGTIKVGSMLARFDNALKVKHRASDRSAPVIECTKSTDSTTQRSPAKTAASTLTLQQQQSLERERQEAMLAEQQRIQAEQQLAEQHRVADVQRQAEADERSAEQARLAEQQRLQDEQLRQELIAKQAELDRLADLEQQRQFDIIRQEAIEAEKQRLHSEKSRQYQLKVEAEQTKDRERAQQDIQYEANCADRAVQHYASRCQRQCVHAWREAATTQQLRHIKRTNNTKRISKTINSNLVATSWKHWRTLSSITRRHQRICQSMQLFRHKQAITQTFKQWKTCSQHSKQLVDSDKYCQRHLLLRTIHRWQTSNTQRKQHKAHQQATIETLNSHVAHTSKVRLIQCFNEWYTALQACRQAKADAVESAKRAEQKRLDADATASLRAQQLAEQAEQQRVAQEAADAERAAKLAILQQQKQQRLAEQLAKQQILLEQQRLQAEAEEATKQQRRAELEAKRVKREADARQQKQAEAYKQQQAEQAKLVESLVADKDEINDADAELQTLAEKEQALIDKHAAVQRDVDAVIQALLLVKQELAEALEAEKIAEEEQKAQQVLEQKRLKLLHVLFDPLVNKKTAAASKARPIR